MQHVQRALHHIHSELAQANSRSEVRIATTGTDLQVTVQATDPLSRLFAQIWRIISAVAALFDGSIVKNSTRANEVYDSCKRFFGEKRIERLQNQYSFSLEGGVLPPTCFDIEKLFVAAATISITDIQELLQEIQKNETIRGCTSEETQMLHRRFRGKTLADCSKQDLDLLMLCLAPFEGNDCFISKPPTYTLPLSTFEMQRQLVHNLRTIAQKNWSHVEWANYIGKHVTPRDPEIGTIIPHPHGYYEVMERIENNGACALLLRPIGNALSSLEPLVLFRGTRSLFPGDLKNPSAVVNSLKEDLYEEIGREGIISSYNSLKNYLCNPELGFVSDPDQKVWGVGCSLGGAHLQRTAILFPERFDQLVTIASPGIEKESATLYAALLKEKNHCPTIHHVIDFADLVPLFGDCHLGYGCTAEEAQVTIHVYQEESTSGVNYLWEFLMAIPIISHVGSFVNILAHVPRAHTQAAHIEPHRVFRFSQSAPISQLIQGIAQRKPSLSDYNWEYLRKKFFAFKASSSFATFVQETKSVAI